MKAIIDAAPRLTRVALEYWVHQAGVAADDAIWTTVAQIDAADFAQRLAPETFPDAPLEEIDAAILDRIRNDSHLLRFYVQQSEIFHLVEALAARLVSGQAPLRPQFLRDVQSGAPPAYLVLKLRDHLMQLPVCQTHGTLEVATALLFFHPELGAQVAREFDEAIPSEWVQKEELIGTAQARRLLEVRPLYHPDVMETQLLGLAISGGGIRSATFGLGVIQALANLRLLTYFDYTSTVSGGGYIGSWLHSWIFRQVESAAESIAARGDVGGEAEMEECAKSAMNSVREALSPDRTPNPEDPAAEPIKWLRSYSNYLAPRLGFLSADTWSIGTIWVRNTILNLLVLVLSLGSIMFAVRGLGMVLELGVLGNWALVIQIVALALGVAIIVRNMISFRKGDDPDDFWMQPSVVAGCVQVSAILLGSWISSTFNPSSKVLDGWLPRLLGFIPWAGPWMVAQPRHVQIDCFVSLVMFVLLVAISFVGYGRTPEETGVAGTQPVDRGFFQLLAMSTGKHGLLRLAFFSVVFNGAAAALGGWLLYVTGGILEHWARGSNWHQFVWGTFLVEMVFSSVIVFHLGLFGRVLDDYRREWWSRLGAVLAIHLAGWVFLAGITVYGPWLIASLVTMAYGSWIASGVGAGWIFTTLAGLVRARNENARPGGGQRQGSMLTRIAPPVFCFGLLVLLSLGVHVISLRWARAKEPFTPSPNGSVRVLTEYESKEQDGSKSLYVRQQSSISAASQAAKQALALDCRNGCESANFAQLAAFHYALLSAPGLFNPWLLFLVCLMAALMLSARIDINEFSMHNFYENRLVRCYLGAANRRRRPNRFTGLDRFDEIPLADFSPYRRQKGRPYPGPLPIVNVALNLVSGAELAWQERKAESFIFTPLHSGFAVSPTVERGENRSTDAVCYYGYRPTDEFGFYTGGIYIGKAMAISGAAASPNMGYHTSATASFLMTVFNVRLGWWIGNPRHRTGWKLPGPRFGLTALFDELLGRTTNKNSYVYLSDGGHFENLGVYELVRRRCRFIVVSDGSQDEHFTFEDLGNAIRKCRTDFGVEIDIDLAQLRPVAQADAGVPRSQSHCALGTIHYPGHGLGTLLYLKTSLTGDEPTDVLQYASGNAEFPHQSTGDQFFNESQFESYRRLGFHVGMDVFGETVRRWEKEAERAGNSFERQLNSDRAGFFADLRQLWYAGTPENNKLFSRHTTRLSELMDRLSKDDRLSFLDAQLTPEWERLQNGTKGMAQSFPLELPIAQEQRRAGFYFCTSLIQLMEDVYLDLNLEEQCDHPDNTGWMNVFRHWAWSSMFRVTWLISLSCFGSRFRQFIEFKLGLDLPSLGALEIVEAGGPDDDRLNFHEKHLLSQANFDWTQHKLYLLEVVLFCPQQPGTTLARMTSGMAVVDLEGYLVYFRVQDHLRSIGIARRFIDEMVIHRLDLHIRETPKWHPMPPDFAERVSPQNAQKVGRMLRSAALRRSAG